jgi:RepB DNA-primase from phage plasmid
LYQQLERPEDLFEHIFGDSAGFLVSFTGRQARFSQPDARQNELAYIEQKSFRYPAEGERAAGYLRDEAAKERDAYVAVHLFREPNTRLAAHTVPTVLALWLDEDEGAFPEAPLGPEPTAVISSSARRRHLYWQLTRAVSVEWAVAMNRRIATWAGGDVGKAGLASVLRAPGTRNFKRHPRVDQVMGVLTGVRPWDPEVLDQAVPPLPEHNTPLNPPRGTYDGPEIELLDYVRSAGIEILGEAADGGGRKFAIVCPWVDEHSGGDRTGTYAGQYGDGALWFYCHHEHCHGRGWRDLRRKARPAKAGKVVIRLV